MGKNGEQAGGSAPAGVFTGLRREKDVQDDTTRQTNDTTAAPPEPEPAPDEHAGTSGVDTAPVDTAPVAEAEGAAEAADTAPVGEAEEVVEAEDAGEGEGEGAAAAGDPAARPSTRDDDADAEPAAVAPLQADLAKARAEAEAYLDDLRRLQADFDNYRKRMLREQTARMASASQALVERLLPVLDNFELAVSAAEQARDFDRMLKGVEMVFGELREVLHGEGLEPIEAQGKPFDPGRHEAVVAVEQDGVEPGVVVDVVRTGYELNGKVLRPAMVKVSR